MSRPLVSSRIKRMGGGCKAAEFVVNGWTYGINVDYLPGDSEQWFLEVMGKHLADVHTKATYHEQYRTQKALRELAGL